ncbi:hypothetical protein JXK06_00850 [Patescibacteria group bacterium]|nr:hypothetical protein [Patescibacteria group bacterium]
MFKILKPIKTILLIIVFMFLAVVASVNFGNDENRKIELKENYLWQGANTSISFLLLGVESFSKLNFNNRLDALKNESESGEENIETFNLNSINDEFQDKLNKIKFENKFSNFLSFFQAQFVRLEEGLEMKKE